MITKEPAPILVSPLFRELHGHLLDLLRSLTPEDWHRPTVCSAWCVKDIASHLLDGDLRRLSIQRDGYTPPDAPTGFESHESLVAYLTRLNADWTAATRRISPRTLIRLLEVSGEEVADLFESADPSGPATFPVGWAGEAESSMWFDLAREYTERWHHQRQIALAVGRPTPIDARRLYHPVLDDLPAGLALHLPGRGCPGGHDGGRHGRGGGRRRLVRPQVWRGRWVMLRRDARTARQRGS